MIVPGCLRCACSLIAFWNVIQSVVLTCISSLPSMPLKMWS